MGDFERHLQSDVEDVCNRGLLQAHRAALAACLACLTVRCMPVLDFLCVRCIRPLSFFRYLLSYPTAPAA